MTDNAEEQKDDTKQKKQPKVVVEKEASQMKPGDYTLHILIQKAKDLDFGDDAEGSETQKVIVEVQVQNQKHSSKVFENVTATTVINVDTHIFVELMKQSVADLEGTKIMIKLNTHGYFKSSLIGQIELDLTYIYNLEKHTKEHAWYAMINPDSEDFSAVAAYMKLSASIYGVDDKPMELKMDTNEDDSNCTMPASLKPKFTQLKMHIIKGEHLPKLDVKLVGEGSMDALICAKINGKQIKTQCITTVKDEVFWYETILIPVRLPIMSGKLIFNVMDRDNLIDEKAGSLIFDFKKLLEMPQQSFFWANIYGAPGQEEVKMFEAGDIARLADEMNDDPTKATKWKGRILIGVEHEPSEAPKLGTEPMPVEPPKGVDGKPLPGAKTMREIAKEYMDDEEYVLMYEFNSVLNTPEKLGKYNLQLSIAEHSWVSKGGDDARAVGYNYNRWNQRSELITFKMPYEQVEHIDDIFLYLCPDKGGLGGMFGGKGKVANPISYVKLKAKDFMDPNPKLQWVELQPEPIEDEVDSPELAGIVGFRLTIRKKYAKDDFGKLVEDQETKSMTAKRDDNRWTKRLARRPDSAKIRCYLFQCRDLPAADDDGSSDPLVVVYNTVDQDANKDRMRKQVCETKAIDDNCDPMFYELLELKIDYSKGEDLPPFIFDVYDVDKNLVTADGRDYLGRCVIDVKDAAYKIISEAEDTEDMRPVVPKWHPVRYSQGSPKCGEILVSFVQTQEFDHQWKIDNEHVKMMGVKDDSAVVRFDEYLVELNVLGLRGLVSPGLLPVKKAYIEFMLKSMVPPIAASALETISTQPGPSGANPTINSVVSFSVPMPVNPLYAPSMACRVYDKVFKGFSGQIIGSFTIPIGQIMIDQQAEYEANCKSLDYVINYLDDVISGKAILDYQPTQPADKDNKIIEQNSIKAEKTAQHAAFDKSQAKEETKTLKQTITDKIAPQPPKPTSVLQKRIQQKKTNQLKRRLLINTDEDSDSDGETTINPVALNDTENLKYMPPSLAINEPSASGTSRVSSRIEELARTPRSSMSDSEKRELSKEALLQALQDKHDPDLLKKVTPQAGQPFKPPAPPSVTANDVDKIIKAASAANSPAVSQSSVKIFNPSKTGMNRELMEIYNSQADAISRESNAQRKAAKREWRAAHGNEVKMIYPPKYKMDERLGVMRENVEEKPPEILFEELGWDRTPGEGAPEKHYRSFTDKELEKDKEIMSKESEFNTYQIKRGQTRGASGGFSLFGGPKTDQATGEADTTSLMGIFKALITVQHKETHEEKHLFMMRKLSTIREKLAIIYEDHFKKDFPLPEGFFCENAGIEASKVMTAGQRERAYSDDIKAPKMIETRESERLERERKSPGSQLTGKSNKTVIRFDAKASTILNSEGRANFKKLMGEMKLTHLQIMRRIVDVQSDEIIKRLLMQETKCCVRVYIVRAFNLAARDNDSPSDPYVKLILGDQEHNDRENYKTDDPEPDIYKMFEFQAVFPGCPMLEVEFWDADLLFGDDFIGSTKIDLEDRYFSSDFKAFQHKPIEHRKLSHPTTEISQGTVVMWAEINEMFATKESTPLWDISKKPTEDFEVRVVVWDTEELEMMDAEGTTDGFVRCFFNSDESKDTDTHFRNQDGKCSWNYRLLFPMTYPVKKQQYKLTVQAYDLDLFKSNDLIGETVIDLTPLFEDGDLAKRGISLTKDYYDEYLVKEKKMKGLTFEKEDTRQFWVDLKSKGSDGKLVFHGRVKMGIDVIPKRDALANPVGGGQSEPNVNPFLPKPFGRIEFTLNPFKMLAQLIGPALRRKLYCYCCCAICCALCIMMAPMIFSNLIVGMLTPG